jgi:hypothetical protein
VKLNEYPESNRTTRFAFGPGANIVVLYNYIGTLAILQLPIPHLQLSCSVIQLRGQAGLRGDGNIKKLPSNPDVGSPGLRSAIIS